MGQGVSSILNQSLTKEAKVNCLIFYLVSCAYSFYFHHRIVNEEALAAYSLLYIYVDKVFDEEKYDQWDKKELQSFITQVLDYPHPERLSFENEFYQKLFSLYYACYSVSPAIRSWLKILLLLQSTIPQNNLEAWYYGQWKGGIAALIVDYLILSPAPVTSFKLGFLAQILDDLVDEDDHLSLKDAMNRERLLAWTYTNSPPLLRPVITFISHYIISHHPHHYPIAHSLSTRLDLWKKLSRYDYVKVFSSLL